MNRRRSYLAAPRCRQGGGDIFGPVLGWAGPSKYHPEEHYMRGPGPKWREKHFHDRASVGGT